MPIKLENNRYILGLLRRESDKGSARLSFSPKYCKAVAKNSLFHAQ